MRAMSVSALWAGWRDFALHWQCLWLVPMHPNLALLRYCRYKQQGPFPVFLSSAWDVFAACTGTCGALWCLVSPQLAASRVSYKTSTAAPDCEAGKRVSLKISVKGRGSDPDPSVSCLGSSEEQHLLSCWSLSHLMGDGILHFISFQWLYQAIDVFQWWPKMLLNKKQNSSWESSELICTEHLAYDGDWEGSMNLYLLIKSTSIYASEISDLSQHSSYRWYKNNILFF